MDGHSAGAHSLQVIGLKKLIHDNHVLSAATITILRSMRWRKYVQILHECWFLICGGWGLFFSVGNLPFQQCLKGFGQRSQDLLTQAHADMSTCSSPSWAHLILPISQGRRWQQLPLHTRAPQMEFIYSSHPLLLSLLVFIWIHPASFHCFLLRSPFPSPAICFSRPIHSSPSPDCSSAVTHRLRSAGSGWRILQIKLDAETTENAGKENGPARCSGCLASSRNPFSVNTAAAAAFGYVTLWSSMGINGSSSRQRA